MSTGMRARWVRLGKYGIAFAMAVVLAVGTPTAASAADTAAVTGTVAGPTSGALREIVTVSLYKRNSGNTAWDYVQNTVTDGEYFFSGLSAGSYTLQVQPRATSTLAGTWWGGRPSAGTALAFNVGENANVVLPLLPLPVASAISGSATVSTGKALAGALVSLYKQVSGSYALVKSDDTDPLGGYRFAGLQPGLYQVSFVGTLGTKTITQWWDAKSSAGTAQVIDLKSNAPQTAKAVFSAPVTVRGTLSSGTGIAAGGLAVTLTKATAPATVLTATTSTSGAYSFANVPAGEYRIHAERADTVANRTIAIADGIDATIDLALLLRMTAGAPVAAGTALVGSVLTAKPGTWTTGATFTYQWYANGAALDRPTTKPTLTLTAAHRDKQITVLVTGSRSGYTPVSQRSAATAKVATAGTPTIAGTAAYGATLTAKPGVWTTGATLRYQWLADGTAISGATKSTLKLSSATKGKRISVRVTGAKSGYPTIAKASAATPKVATTAKPKITGTKKVGSTLKAVPGTWTKGTKFSYQWYANGKAISKATKSSYKLKAAQKGKKISVRVTGKKSGYATVAKTSSVTSKVK